MSESLILEAGPIHLAFGMRWFAVLAERPRKAARRLGRQFHATHVAHAGTTPSVVGLAWLGNAGSVYSAAQAVAMRYPSGSVALRMALRPGLIWLVAVHEGLVIARTDRLFDDPEPADRLLAELKLAYPGLIVAGETPAIGLADLAQMAQSAGQAGQISALRRLRRPLPRPVSILFCVLGLAAVLPGIYGGDVAARLGRMDDDSPDAVTVASLYAARAAGIEPTPPLVHGIAGLKGLLDTFHAVPLRPAGWRLSHAYCDAGDDSIWRCAAHYERDAAQASNAGLFGYFESICPGTTRQDASIGVVAQACHWPGLRIAFASLDQAHVSWRPDVRAVALTQTRPMGNANNDRQLLSALQGVRGAFSDIQVGEPLALQMAAPPDDAARNGQADASGYRSRSLHISGPLRSAALLLEHASFIGWRRAELRHLDVDAPDIRRSRLHFTLQGLLYEIDATPVPGSGPETAWKDEAIPLEAP